jgi:hypothetical protein
LVALLAFHFHTAVITFAMLGLQTKMAGLKLLPVKVAQKAKKVTRELAGVILFGRLPQ